MEYLAIFIGGGTGSLVRFGISKWLGTTESGFPIGTFAANILACLVLGIAFNYLAEKSSIHVAHKSLVLIGFCGGFSTFSTFSNETLLLIQGGEWGMALLYIALSVGSCVGLLAIISRF